MKDYIVYFTEGFDEHTINKQKSVFENAYISCINSKPDYNKLVEESKIAKSKGFDNFYIFWKRNDVPDMNREMVSEFKKLFKETGAIPYKYNRLSEGDTSASTANAQQSGAQPVGNQPAGNQPAGGQNQNGTNPSNPGVASGDQQDPNETTFIVENGVPKEVSVQQGDSVNLSNTRNIYNAVYSKDHAATVFIWPFNLFMTETFAQNAWISFAAAVKTDTVSHLPTGVATSTVNSSKKGNWQRIIYVPQSIADLGQSVGRADTIYKFTKDAMMGYPFNNGGFTKTAAIYNKMITNQVEGRGGAKVAFGNLTEADIVRACQQNGATNASIRNIHIVYPPIYKPYMKWCPIDKCSEMSAVNFPSIELNNKQLQNLAQMKEFIATHKNNPKWMTALSKIYTGTNNKLKEDGTPDTLPTDCLRSMISHDNLYAMFWKYWNIYISQEDVYGRPDGKGTNALNSTLDDLGDRLDRYQNTTGGNNGMDDVYKAAGWLPKDQSTSSYGQFGGKKFLNDIKQLQQNAEITKKNIQAAKDDVSDVATAIKNKAQQIQDKAKQNAPAEDKEYKSVYDDVETESYIKGSETIPNQDTDEKENQKNTDKESNETKDSQVSEKDKDSTNNDKSEQGNNGNAAEDQLTDLQQDHLICQLSPQWSKVYKNGVSWVGHVFYSDETFKTLEGMTQQKDQEGHKYIPSTEGYTIERATIVLAEIDRLLKDTASSVAQPDDGQDANSTAVPKNSNTNNTQAKKDEEKSSGNGEKEEFESSSITRDNT